VSVSVQSVPMFSDNYAWLLRDSASGAVGIVDPADAGKVCVAIDAAGGRLDTIFLTHHHADHVAGTDEVRARYGAKVVGASADAHRLPRLDQAVAEGDSVAFGTTEARVIETPGHTRGHIAFFFPQGDLLFCGDTLFSLGCGRLLEGTAEEMFASLAKLAALPADTAVFCGHEYTQSNARFALTVEPDNAALRARAAEVTRLREASANTVPSRLEEELAANPFLRASTASRLGEIRTAKDRF
jgi:hydroxyacylglutathione hydrolase